MTPVAPRANVVRRRRRDRETCTASSFVAFSTPAPGTRTGELRAREIGPAPVNLSARCGVDIGISADRLGGYFATPLDRRDRATSCLSPLDHAERPQLRDATREADTLDDLDDAV